MELRPVRDVDELSVLADVAAPLQADPASHVVYLGTESTGILAELAAATWRDVSVVATRDDEVVGWLIGDVDADMGRVWWLGPFIATADWEALATSMMTRARPQLPDGVIKEELAVDSRFERCRRWAIGEGFHEEAGAYVLLLEQRLDPPTAPIREISDADHDAVVRLHDESFANTHTTSEALVAGHDATHRRLVVERDGVVVGYVAVEIQADGSGYIDYLGVAQHARRAGLGGELVRAGVAELRRLGATDVSLTVREDSAGARELYASLGFREERLAVPLRRGFSVV